MTQCSGYVDRVPDVENSEPCSSFNDKNPNVENLGSCSSYNDRIPNVENLWKIRMKEDVENMEDEENSDPWGSCSSYKEKKHNVENLGSSFNDRIPNVENLGASDVDRIADVENSNEIPVFENSDPCSSYANKIPNVEDFNKIPDVDDSESTSLRFVTRSASRLELDVDSDENNYALDNLHLQSFIESHMKISFNPLENKLPRRDDTIMNIAAEAMNAETIPDVAQATNPTFLGNDSEPDSDPGLVYLFEESDIREVVDNSGQKYPLDSYQRRFPSTAAVSADELAEDEEVALDDNEVII